MTGPNYFKFGNAFTFANDISRLISFVPRDGIILTDGSHAQSFPTVFGRDDRSTILFEIGILGHGQTRLFQQFHHFQGNGRRTRQSGGIDTGHMNKVGILFRCFNDPIAAITLGAGTAKGVNGFGRIKRRHEVFAFAQNVFLDGLIGHVSVVGIVHVASRGSENQIAPQGGLDEYALAEFGIGARKESAIGQVALLFI